MWFVTNSGAALVLDGTVSYVPDDPANSDWQAYQEWLAEGNTPEPWPPNEGGV